MENGKPLDLCTVGKKWVIEMLISSQWTLVLLPAGLCGQSAGHAGHRFQCAPDPGGEKDRRSYRVMDFCLFIYLYSYSDNFIGLAHFNHYSVQIKHIKHHLNNSAYPFPEIKSFT